MKITGLFFLVLLFSTSAYALGGTSGSGTGTSQTGGGSGGGAPTGPAGGDLSGTYPNPTVSAFIKATTASIAMTNFGGL